MVRVQAMDSAEGITDFWSATDHGITLRKFQELNMPITVPSGQSVGGFTGLSGPAKNNPSVFEEEHDFTAIDLSKRASVADKRWKFTGPWLAGMTQGEFAKWIEKSVRPKRAEFREFLKRRLAEDEYQTAAARALDSGEDVPAGPDAMAITEDQLVGYLRKLRNNNEKLFDMVGEFLDLAPLQPPGLGYLGSDRDGRSAANPYSASGPPVSHPSAGLSYLRTTAYLDNHPFYGPQTEHPPVEARLLRPRRPAAGLDAKLGVAGFVADRPFGEAKSNSNARGYIYDTLNLDKKGGSTVFVQVREAKVTSKGYVDLEVTDADTEAYLVAQELLGVDEKQTFRPPQKAPSRQPLDRASQIRKRYRVPPTAMSSADQYGVGLGDSRFSPTPPANGNFKF